MAVVALGVALALVLLLAVGHVAAQTTTAQPPAPTPTANVTVPLPWRLPIRLHKLLDRLRKALAYDSARGNGTVTANATTAVGNTTSSTTATLKSIAAITSLPSSSTAAKSKLIPTSTTTATDGGSVVFHAPEPTNQSPPAAAPPSAVTTIAMLAGSTQVATQLLNPARAHSPSPFPTPDALQDTSGIATSDPLPFSNLTLATRAPWCGNGLCDADETCETCAYDCAMILADRLLACDVGLQRCVGASPTNRLVVLAADAGTSATAAADDAALLAGLRLPVVTGLAPPAPELVGGVQHDPMWQRPVQSVAEMPRRLLLPFLPPGAEPDRLKYHPQITSNVYFAPAGEIPAAARWFAEHGWRVVSERESTRGVGRHEEARSR
ncbi:hypothetical protein H9P43_005635 [Blastocladiella emersonii ATCC 22665]|nr:hypothetical protein H9P43_005635 [Blastocladiella emersonii ATCC 22665]